MRPWMRRRQTPSHNNPFQENYVASPNIPQGQQTLSRKRLRLFKEAGIDPNMMGYNVQMPRFTPGPVANVYYKDESEPRQEAMGRAQFRKAVRNKNIICVEGINCDRHFGTKPTENEEGEE